MERKYNNISEFTIEELIRYKSENPNQEIIIENSNKELNRTDSYSIEDMIKIKEKVKAIIEDIPKDITEPDREKKVFTYLYTKLAYMIEYDELAESYVGLGGYEREMSEPIRNRASNLVGGLLHGRSLCGGYSEILRNILAELGIESVYISGEGKDGLGNHAWNQVKLDGNWYNVDLTNDRDAIVEGKNCSYFLKSNNEFGKYEEYNITSKTLHQCTDSFENSNKLLEQYQYVKPVVNHKSIAEADKSSKLTTSIIKNAKNIINRILNKEKEKREKAFRNTKSFLKIAIFFEFIRI